MDIKRLKKALLDRKAVGVKWGKKHRRELAIGSVSVLAIALVVFVVMALFSNTSDGGNTMIEDVVDDDGEVFRHPLTGDVLDWTGGAVPNEPMDLPPVFGVMIENSAEAWPLAGLDEAFLVIEAPVEANIPRFIAFFSGDNEVDKIGPVRSARPYYLDWNSEFDAIYGHVGGSPEALDLLADYGTYDLNEFYQGEYYYRQNGTRYAPHNVYTNSELFTAAFEEVIERYDVAKEDIDYGVWTFKDDEPTTESSVSFDLDWSEGTTYDIAWNYDTSTNAYLRDQKATSYFLENNADAIANNVVVIETTVTVVDAMGRRHLRTIGEGDAMIFHDGKVVEATWKKSSRTERLRFYDAFNNELAINAGVTWIEVVDDLAKVTQR